MYMHIHVQALPSCFSQYTKLFPKAWQRILDFHTPQGSLFAAARLGAHSALWRGQWLCWHSRPQYTALSHPLHLCRWMPSLRDFPHCMQPVLCFPRLTDVGVSFWGWSPSPAGVVVETLMPRLSCRHSPLHELLQQSPAAQTHSVDQACGSSRKYTSVGGLPYTKEDGRA